jgi:cytochrome P450
MNMTHSSFFQTASTLTFVIYLLAITPTVLARLREEVFSHVGTSKAPTYDDIREMKFLRAVINGQQT